MESGEDNTVARIRQSIGGRGVRGRGRNPIIPVIDTGDFFISEDAASQFITENSNSIFQQEAV